VVQVAPRSTETRSPAKAFAQRAVDQDEVRRRSGRREPSGRRDADEKGAAAGEQLLGDQHGKRRPNGAADDSELDAVIVEAIKLGVIAGPASIEASSALHFEAPDDIPVRIEHAYRGDARSGDTFLTARLAQQIFRRECRRRQVVLLR